MENFLPGSSLAVPWISHTMHAVGPSLPREDKDQESDKGGGWSTQACDLGPTVL